MSLKRALFVSLNALCVGVLFFVFITAKPNMYSNSICFLIIFLSVLINLVSILFLKYQKTKMAKILFLINVIFTLVFTILHILRVNNLLFIFSSVSQFKEFILSTKEKGIIIYILIQMAQVIFLPVPASIIALAGAIVFGPLLGSIYCSLGVLLGSYISFFLGRTIGVRLVEWVAGKDNAVKYASILNNSGKLFLGIAFLLPMFPDDILCLISGITSMKFKYFFIITTIFRPIGVICMCYFGGGYIIPFRGWGMPVWIVIGLLMTIFIIITYKYQNKMEEWVVSKFKRKNKKRG